jgi:putative flippase GtrA
VSFWSWQRELFRVARFGLVGVLSAIVYAAVTSACFALERNIMLATIIGQVGSTIVSYFGHLHFSFAVPPQHRIFIIRFLFVVGATLLMNVTVTWLFSSVVAAPYQLSILIVAVLNPPMSYLASRFWVFLPGPSASLSLHSMGDGQNFKRELD